MLYLAEVVKKGGFRGGKAELKLLARQQSEQNWNALPSEELISAEEANKFNSGALVFVELSPSHQTQNIYEAARQLVGILQNFSRSREKFRAQEEEIEGWKQSLIYQSQELAHRELDFEARQEELQQLEEASEKLEQQRQETKATSEEAQRLQEEVERNRQELEGAWEHLRGEMRRLEEDQNQQAKGLDDQQLWSIEELLNRLLGAMTSGESTHGGLSFALEPIAQQQAVLDQHWQKLEQQRGSAQEHQAEVDLQVHNLETSWQAWQQSQRSLEQAQVELKLKEQALNLKDDYARTLARQVQAQADLYQKLSQLTGGTENENLGEQVDIQALRTMSLEELTATVEALQKGLEGVFRFVHDQEEELALQQQAIEELQEKINQASEYDRLSLEGDLEFEQQSYQMLNETLVGQRRNLREREEILDKHRAVLLQRQGQPQKQENQLDLEPFLLQLAAQCQQQAKELQELESQAEQLRPSIQHSQETIEQQSRDQDAQRNELKQLELALQSQRSAVAELWGKTNAYQEILQPMQDGLNELRQKLTTLEAEPIQSQQGDEQRQVVEEIRRLVMALAQSPELAAS